MAIVVATGSPLPNTVSGVSATWPSMQASTNGLTAGPQAVKLFSSIINAPGSLRMDGSEAIVRAAGNITGGVATNTQFCLYLNYPTLATGAAQYPLANITAAVTINSAQTNGPALFNANNNFVVGQYVSVNMQPNTQFYGIVGPLTVANSTAFAGLINGANVVNASTGATVNTSTTGYATMLPQPLYIGLNTVANLNVGQTCPWMAEVRIQGDAGSNVVFAYGIDGVVNYNLVAAGTAAQSVNDTAVWVVQQNVGSGLAVPGINFRNEPPFTLQVGEIFSASNANNAATLKSFFLEQ
jgi:hypothetical protein